MLKIVFLTVTFSFFHLFDGKFVGQMSSSFLQGEMCAPKKWGAPSA